MVRKSLILLNWAGLGFKRAKPLFDVFSDPEAVLECNLSQLKEIRGLDEKDALNIVRARESKEFKQELDRIEREGIEVIDIVDPDYPRLLREIYSPPLCLYIRGKREALKQTGFAIVGTRTPTAYGLSMAEKFSASLASLGFVIVSGLARGIDTAVHKGALKAHETIAVLGSGLCQLYPPENQKLSQQIKRQGAVISEFPLATKPLRMNFPRRNRIISGLSIGVLVIEAAQKSGALITANFALEQNREVFALPGKADSPFSRGTHSLIKEGAKLIEDIDDILSELNVEIKSEGKTHESTRYCRESHESKNN